MKPENTLFCLCIIIFCLQQAVAQREGVDAQQNINTLGSGIGGNTVRTFDTRYAGIKGNAFFLPYWCNSEVFLKDGRQYSNVPLKHDVYQNQVVVKRPKGDSVVLNAALISHFTIQDVASGKNYLFKRFPNLKTDQVKLKDEFWQVLQEGKASLLISNDRSLVKADYKGAYNSGRTYDELVDETSYYLLQPDQSLVKIRLNRKSVLESFTDHQAELKAYAEKEKIDFKDEGSVAKLITYYNSLN